MMDQTRSMELDSVVERRRLRAIPSVDSAMLSTPSHSTEHLPEPEVMEQNRQDFMQDVEVKSPVRPRTRFERLTEKHTPQRPNWAMADTDTPSVSHSVTTTRPVKQLRRVPNTIFRPPPVDPSFPLLEQRGHNSVELPHETRTIRTDPLHTTARPNWALGDPTPLHKMSQASTREEQLPILSQKGGSIQGHGNVHPSRIGQISHGHQPTVAPALITRGPVDSGWGQRGAHGIVKPTAVPIHAPQIHPDISRQSSLITGTEYSVKGDSMQWSSKVPGELRKIASSPNNHPHNIEFFNQESPMHYATAGQSYGPQEVNTYALSADMQLHQLKLNLGSISLHHQNGPIFETEIPDSHGDRLPATGPQGQYTENHQSPPDGVRPMHSAPDLMQRSIPTPNPDLASTFLEIRHPRPTQATEYVGALPGHPATLHRPLTENTVEVSHVATGSRVLRRVPRFPAVNASGVQQRPVYDRSPGTKPAHTMVEHAFAMELFTLQRQEAEDPKSGASSPDFHYDGIDSLGGRPFTPTSC